MNTQISSTVRLESRESIVSSDSLWRTIVQHAPVQSGRLTLQEKKSFFFTVYKVAQEAHHGERRRGSGNPEYFTHPIAVLQLLHKYSPPISFEGACSALLHDVMENTKLVSPNALIDAIMQEFCNIHEGRPQNHIIGECLRNIVNDVKLLSKKAPAEMIPGAIRNIVEKTRRTSSLSEIVYQGGKKRSAAYYADRLSYLSRDPNYERIVRVKLADRLHNLLTVDGDPAYTQGQVKLQKLIQETEKIFIPMADRLGFDLFSEALMHEVITLKKILGRSNSAFGQISEHFVQLVFGILEKFSLKKGENAPASSSVR